MVAPARNHLQANKSRGFCFEIPVSIRVSVTTTLEGVADAVVPVPRGGIRVDSARSAGRLTAVVRLA